MKIGVFGERMEREEEEEWNESAINILFLMLLATSVAEVGGKIQIGLEWLSF